MTLPQGAAGRVAQVQRQAWATLRIAAAFLVAAAIAGVAGGQPYTWLALHLLLLGGVLSAVSAATQLFAVTWSASPAPPDALAAIQRWLLAAGAVVVVVARERDAGAALAGLGGGAVLVALALLAVILLRVRRTVVTDRFVPAIDVYLAAIAVGIGGSGLGVAMASGGVSPGDARTAHIALNLFGLVGLVVLGTLPTFVATQVRAKVSRRATPARLRGLGGAMATATLLATVGLLVDVGAFAGAGFAVYAVTAGSVAALLPALGPKQRAWAGPRLLQLLCGVGWWVVAAAWAALWSLDVVSGDRWWLLLGVGGYAQLVVGSLAYLGPILRGRDHESQARAFRITRSWVSVGAGNVVAVAIAAGWWVVVTLGIAVWLVDLAVRGTLLVWRVRPAPLPSGG